MYKLKLVIRWLIFVVVVELKKMRFLHNHWMHLMFIWILFSKNKRALAVWNSGAPHRNLPFHPAHKVLSFKITINFPPYLFHCLIPMYYIYAMWCRRFAILAGLHVFWSNPTFPRPCSTPLLYFNCNALSQEKERERVKQRTNIQNPCKW